MDVSGEEISQWTQEKVKRYSQRESKESGIRLLKKLGLKQRSMAWCYFSCEKS